MTHSDSTDVVRTHFDRVAPTYETNRLGPWYIAHGRFIADHLDGRRFDTALDIGCGTGWLLRELHRRGIAIRAIGLDLSPGMVRVARSRAAADASTSIEFLCDAWPDVTAETAALLDAERPDLMIFASSLHYAVDVAETLSSARSVLAPGGTLVILERAPERSGLTRMWGRAHEVVIRDGARFTPTEELLDHLRAAGFEDVREAARLNRWFWRGKLNTSMALSTGRAPTSVC